MYWSDEVSETVWILYRRLPIHAYRKYNLKGWWNFTTDQCILWWLHHQKRNDILGLNSIVFDSWADSWTDREFFESLKRNPRILQDFRLKLWRYLKEQQETWRTVSIIKQRPPWNLFVLKESNRVITCLFLKWGSDIDNRCEGSIFYTFSYVIEIWALTFEVSFPSECIVYMYLDFRKIPTCIFPLFQFNE